MALVSIETEKYIINQRRFVLVYGEIGVGGHAEWKEQTRSETTTVTNHKGDEADVRAKLNESAPKDDKESRTMRKSDGPWWEANVTTVTYTDWEDIGTTA